MNISFRPYNNIPKSTPSLIFGRKTYIPEDQYIFIPLDWGEDSDDELKKETLEEKLKRKQQELGTIKDKTKKFINDLKNAPAKATVAIGSVTAVGEGVKAASNSVSSAVKEVIKDANDTKTFIKNYNHNDKSETGTANSSDSLSSAAPESFDDNVHSPKSIKNEEHIPVNHNEETNDNHDYTDNDDDGNYQDEYDDMDDV